MFNCNRVALIGNVGQNPELKTTKDGTPYVRLAVATNERWKDAEGAVKTRAEWHNVVFWDRLGETAARRLKKGSYVSVEGIMRSREYVDQAGVSRRIWEVR